MYKITELKRKLYIQKEKIENFERQYGCKIKNEIVYPSRLSSYTTKKYPNTLHYHVIKQIREKLEDINKKKKNDQANRKKLAKGCLKQITQREQKEIKEKKQIIKNQINRAKEISISVYKNFWTNSFRFLKIINEKKLKVHEKLSQEKKMNKFLKIQADLADEILTEINKSNQKNKELIKKKNEKNISFIINFKKQKKGYLLTNIEKKKKENIIAESNLTLFKGNLRYYQKIGVQWLNTLSMMRTSCILADEMGLGKTVQTIAHLAFLAEKKGIWGPHLIVVPTTVLGNWLEEFNRFLPCFKIFGYYGRSSERKKKRKGWSELNKFNVCVTTYRIVSIDSKIFKRKKWFSLILDEAHLIKNSKTQCFMTLMRIKSINRILLTGTPLQNKLKELWTLMTFLFPEKFGNRNVFCSNMDVFLEKAAKNNSNVYNAIIKKLHSILRPLILRRLKCEVEKQLPKKTEKIILCKLSRRQKVLYDQFIMNTTQKERRKNLGFVQSLNVLMQLRKICNHPDLVDEKFSESASIYTPIYYYVPKFVDFEAFKIKFSFQTLPEKNLNLGNLLLALLCKEHYNIESLNVGKNFKRYKKKKIFLRTTRNFVRSFNYNINDNFSKIQSICKIKKKKRINDYLIFHKNLEEISINIGKKYSNYIFRVKKVDSNGIKTNLPKKEYNHLQKLKKLIITPIPKIFTHNINNFIADSGKLKKLYKLLMQMRKEKRKVVIFTQMSKMLNSLEIFLSYKGFTFIRLDGSIVTEKRQKLVKKFNQNKKIMIFISSTRVGGIGINLTSANTVIFYDCDWNPAVDKQAQDRCHRIGQNQNVTIYKLVTKHTIEENILMTSNIKSKIDDLVLNKGRFTLRQLFKTFFNDSKITKKEREDYITKYLSQVEEKDDKMETETKTEFIEEDNTFKDIVQGYQNEIKIIKDILPPIFHYALFVLKQKTGDIKTCLDLEEVEEDEEEEQTFLGEDEGDSKAQDFKRLMERRNMDVDEFETGELVLEMRSKLMTLEYFN